MVCFSPFYIIPVFLTLYARVIEHSICQIYHSLTEFYSPSVQKENKKLTSQYARKLKNSFLNMLPLSSTCRLSRLNMHPGLLTVNFEQIVAFLSMFVSW